VARPTPCVAPVTRQVLPFILPAVIGPDGI
jgi:hypothetical protein